LNERLPEPAGTPAMGRSWPELDETALGPLPVEQSCLRPPFHNVHDLVSVMKTTDRVFLKSLLLRTAMPTS